MYQVDRVPIASKYHLVEAFHRGVAIVALALARIRADTIVGAGGCFFWSEFIVIFVLPSKHSYCVKTGRTINPLIAERRRNSIMNILRGY